jgi:hypothetical protein
MPSKGSIPRVCEQCGTSFGVDPCVVARGSGRFCSQPCAARGRKRPTRKPFGVERTCEQCGHTFRAKANRVRKGQARFCSSRCAADERLSHATERFWSFVRRGRADECWLWVGGVSDGGYGRFSLANHFVPAHRFAYILTHGPILPEIEVCHNCPSGDNTLCVNPAHMFLGTHADNMADHAIKGRSGQAKLTPAIVRTARTRYDAGGVTMTALASEYGITKMAMRRAIRRLTWRHVA